MKVLKYWGLGYLILMLVLAIVALIIYRKKSFIQDYQTIIQANGQTVGDVCESAIYGRLKQLSNFYPNDLPTYT